MWAEEEMVAVYFEKTCQNLPQEFQENKKKSQPEFRESDRKNEGQEFYSESLRSRVSLNVT